MHTAFIGGSRGIGRSAALETLSCDASNTVSFLLRTPSSISEHPDFRQAIASGRVRIVKGDAYNEEDVRRLLEPTGIDSVVSTLGAVYPDGKRQFSWSKGFLLPSLDTCTRAAIILVKVLGDIAKERGSTPSLVAVSVTGVGSSRAKLPYMYQLILPWLLQQTIDDKRGVEAILSHAAASLPDDPDPPSPLVLDHLSFPDIDPGSLKNVLIVRPAQLKDTDGTRQMRAGEEISTYSTGRVELGRWIAHALQDSKTWMNRRVTVGF